MSETLIVTVAIADATRVFDREYDYIAPGCLAGRARVGRMATVPFGAKNAPRRAIILAARTEPEETAGDGAKNEKPPGGQKTVIMKRVADIPEDAPELYPKDVELASEMRKKYFCTWFDALSCMLPAGWRNMRAGAGRPPDNAADPPCDGEAPGARMSGGRPALTRGQQNALSVLSAALDAREFSETLLHGVTGSGKTEIYMRLIERALAQGRRAIALVPEISLTPQMTQRFTDYFGADIAVFHSRLTEKERRRQWFRVRDDKVRIALGARSAIFAPFSDIGAIIIDEEHESSYRSEMTPRYDVKEIARMRAKSHGALILYGSATPSVDLYYRAVRGGCRLLTLSERTNRQVLPKVYIADMREELKNGNRSMFSRLLTNELAGALSKGGQAILFLNRRGYSSFLLCRSCGYIVSCRNCSVSYTYHKDADRLVCHYCGLTAPPPGLCPRCGGAEIGGFGAGTERIEYEIRRMFPKSRTLRMDRDTTSVRDSYSKLLAAFGNGEADIMIGTQMIAKGHDFPGVTLVGALAADSILNFSDFRATERTFQLLTQAAGRSGRGEDAGKVVIQTYNPDHFSVAAAKNHDYAAFFRQETVARRALGYPPFANIGVFLLTGRDDGRARASAERLYKLVADDAPPGLTALGPTRPPHARIRELYRWRFILKHEDASVIEEAARNAIYAFYRGKKTAGVELSFDINPFSML